MRVLVRCCVRCVKCSCTILPVTLFLLCITSLSPRSKSMDVTWEQYAGAMAEKTDRLQEYQRTLNKSLEEGGIGKLNVKTKTIRLQHKRRQSDPLAKQLEKYGLCDNSTFLRLNENISPVMTLCRTFLKQRREYYRRRDFKVNPYIHNLAITGENICNSEPEIIMLIHSLHSYSDRRNAIRKTWGRATQTNEWPGKDLTKTLKIAFVFGTHKDPKQNENIRKESEEFHDVIQGTFSESYSNMTLKSLLGLKFVKTHCRNVKYLLKSDDDMFINFPYLYELLDKLHMRRAFMGPLCIASPVVRKGKWGMSTDLFPFYFFPPYEAGSAYVLTTDIIPELYDTAEYVPHISIDDVYITGILGKILNVTHIRQGGFAFAISKIPKINDIIENKIVTGTRVKPIYQLQLWSELVNRFSKPLGF